MATTTTKRVQAPPSASTTKRVITTGPSTASIGGDTWGNTWGGGAGFQNTWGRTWYFAVASQGEAPSLNQTKRVESTPSSGTTKRVVGPVT